MTDIPEVVSDPIGVTVGLITGIEAGMDHQAAEAVVVGVAGGRAKVAGLVLPEQAAAIRRRAAYLDCAVSPDVDQELTGILRASPDILFVDHADLVPLATFDAVGLAVVLGVRDRALIDELRPEPLTAFSA